MKKLLLTLITIVACATTGRGALAFSDTFNYSDGGIVTNSAGVWVQNTGTANSMLASNQQLIVSSSRTEDIAASLGSTYMTNGSTAALYVSFALKCTALPGTAGAYFTHFTGPNTFGALSGHRARIWASTTNFAAGRLAYSTNFMLSILNSTNAIAGNAQVPTELTTNKTYTIVVRYELATMTAKLWIDPTAETDPSTTGTDFPVDLYDTANGVVNVTSYSFRQASGEGTMLIDNLKVGTQFNDVAGNNTSPLISTIPAQSTPMNAPTAAIPFTVQDGETTASSLIVSNTTANPTLVPLANISLGGSGTNRTLTITPATGQQGSAAITTYVSDGPNTSATTFTLTVGAPSISAIPNQIGAVSTPTAAIPFTVNDSEGDTLTLSSGFSNPGLISGVSFGGSGANRTVTVTPVAAAAGVSTINVIADDGFNTVTQSFKVTFAPAIGLIYSDDFSYGDGSLLGNGTWSTSSGTPLQLQITNGMALIVRTNSEDLNTGTGFGGGSPFAPASGVVLYSGFTINLTELPTSAGNYFAHFKDTGNGFTAKIFVSTAGAAAGHYRIGIANTASTVTASVENDLATNTTYLVVSRYNVATGESVVWVNPVSIASGGVAANDTIGSITVAQYGLREDTAMGTIFLDNLKIGTSLADVAAIPALNQTLNQQVINGELVLTWGAPLFALQSASAVTGPYTTIPGATSPYTNTPTASEKYFRLKY